MDFSPHTRDATIALQSRGEAHLYCAIAKADGIVSKKERNLIGNHAIKAQKLYDVLKINSAIALRIRDDLYTILDDPRYSSWIADDHYNEAIRLLKKAGLSGNWSVSLSSLKHENGLFGVAMIDEYTFVESEAVKKILSRLQRDLKESKTP